MLIDSSCHCCHAVLIFIGFVKHISWYRYHIKSVYLWTQKQCLVVKLRLKKYISFYKVLADFLVKWIKMAFLITQASFISHGNKVTVNSLKLSFTLKETPQNPPSKIFSSFCLWNMYVDCHDLKWSFPLKKILLCLSVKKLREVVFHTGL